MSSNSTSVNPRKAVFEVEKTYSGNYKILVAREFFPEFAKVIGEAFKRDGYEVEFNINEDFIP